MNHSSAHGYTDNEIIAQWMGLKRHEPNADYWKAQYYRPDPKDARKKGDFVCYYDGLEYDTSWDWIMPAVKKWNDLVIEKRKQKHGWTKWQYMTVMLSTDIKKLHKDLIEAIKWYNNQQSK